MKSPPVPGAMRRYAGLSLAIVLSAAAVAATAAQSGGFAVSGQGMTAQEAMDSMKGFARAQCASRRGPDRAGFALDDTRCSTNLLSRMTFQCRARASCTGAAETPAP